MLSVYTSCKKKIVTIKLEGYLCDYIGKEIDINNLCKNSKGIVIDLTGVSQIDSTGLIDLINWTIETKTMNVPIFFKGISKKYLYRLKGFGIAEIALGVGL